MKSLLLLIGGVVALTALFIFFQPTIGLTESPPTGPQEFIGSEVCADCHTEKDLSEAGYNVVEEASKNAHASALMLPNPVFPAGTNDNGVPLPPGTTWDDFAYVMGGFGWKATYILKDGSQLTGADNVQYNLESGEWTAYHPGEDLDFDVDCARCHTTGITPAGSWNGVASDSLGTWNEIGVQCEGCHGPSSGHVTRALTTSEGETRVLQERCGDCHNNGGKQSPIPVFENFVANHAQYQELEASRHGSLGFFTCITCHEPHVAVKYDELIGEPFNNLPLEPFRKQCQDCHPSRETNHPAPTTCVDCHMPAASKSAVGIEHDNGGAQGDIASHIWRINTNPVSREAMFSADGKTVVPDASGWLSVTLDFACLGCHTDAEETIEWAATYAADMHPVMSTSVEEEEVEQPAQLTLVSNYPNPFAQQTTIEYELAAATTVDVSIFNANGQRVAKLEAGSKTEGAHRITWDGQTDDGVSLSSGVYIARLQIGTEVYSHRMVLIK